VKQWQFIVGIAPAVMGRRRIDIRKNEMIPECELRIEEPFSVK
jgi:hypothetical protein